MKKKIKFINFLNEYKKFNENPNCETHSIKKYIIGIHEIDILCFKYNYYSRYIEYDSNFITRWTKSFFRESFALNDGKKIQLPLLYSKLTYLYNSFDYVICLSNKARISVELTHGNTQNLEYEAIYAKFKKKSIVTYIKDSIIFSNISSYNPWHYFVEILCLAYDLSNKKIAKNKKIYIPYNSLFTEIINLLNKDGKIITYSTDTPIIANDCLFYEGFQGEMLPKSSIDKIIKKIKANKKFKSKFYHYKNIYIARGDRDKHRNRRKLVNEKKLINLIKKSFPDLQIVTPGYISIYDAILMMHNSKNIFSMTGTQLVLNSLFSNNPKNIVELTPNNYYGFTTGELVAKYKKTRYFKPETYSKKPGWIFYEDQKANLKSAEEILKLIK